MLLSSLLGFLHLLEAFLEKKLIALGVRGSGFIVLENQPQPLDQNRLHVGLGCILRVGGGRVPKAEAIGPRSGAGRPHLVSSQGASRRGVFWCLLECPGVSLTWRRCNLIRIPLWLSNLLPVFLFNPYKITIHQNSGNLLVITLF